MSCSKPIVATQIPESGVSWVNRHGYSGLNVPIMDSKSLADAILQITDETVYEKYSTQARSHYESNFAYSKMVDRCLSLYDEILSK